MPTEHLPFSGFQVMQPATSEPENISLNSLAAYRIHDPDPILFTSSFRLQWIASSDNGHQNAGYCNYDYPVSSACPHPLAILESGVRSSDILTCRLRLQATAVPDSTPPLLNKGKISVDALAFVYVWDTASVQ
jgi:hypothetical protein